MNIALVVSYLADRYGGPVTVVKHLGQSLAHMGHDVSYWATGDGDGLAEGIAAEKAHIYDMNWPGSWYRSKGIHRGLADAISSLDVLELNEFWLYPVYTASRIARLEGTPYILRPAGSLQSWALKSGRLKRLKKAIYLRLLGDSIVRGAACIHAASVHEAENVRDMGYQGPITVIPNGLDITQFDGADASDAEVHWPDLRNRLVVLFMSRLSPEKGLDILIPAWAQFVASPAYKDAVLVIAGPDYRGYQQVVEGMIEKYSLRRHILMPGMIQGRQKAAMLRRADVFVLPSYQRISVLLWPKRWLVEPRS